MECLLDTKPVEIDATRTQIRAHHQGLHHEAITTESSKTKQGTHTCDLIMRCIVVNDSIQQCTNDIYKFSICQVGSTKSRSLLFRVDHPREK